VTLSIILALILVIAWFAAGAWWFAVLGALREDL